MTHHLLEKKLSKPKPELIRRTLAIGVVALMFQGSSSALTSAWAAGCVENPSFCVSSTLDSGPNTLRSVVASANAALGAETIVFDDSLFGITRTDGVITSSSADANNPVVITLQSTLEIRSDLTIRAPYVSNAIPQILKIARGQGITEGAPLIAVNPSVNGVPASEGATTQVTIENVIIDSNANPNSGSSTQSTPGVAIEVKSTTLPENPRGVTPELVVKNSQIVNSVSESGGAAVSSTGDVKIEGSTLTNNAAVTPNGGAASSGGAIKSEGTVTVLGSAINSNTATGDGGAISAASVVVDLDAQGSMSQLHANTAQGNGGAISSTGEVLISRTTFLDNRAGQIQSGDYFENTETGGDGGAIFSSGNVMITDSTLSDNSAASGSGVSASPGDGGAIFSLQDATALGSTISNNSADGEGGAINARAVVLGATTDITELSYNYSSSNGGAISASGSVTTLSTNSVELVFQTRLHDNWSEGSGGAIATSGTVNLAQAQLSDNVAQNHGGAVFTTSSVIVENSVLNGNVAGGWFEASDIPYSTITGGDGGAISATDSVTITNSTLELNRALAGTGWWGGWETSDYLISDGNGGAIFSGATVDVYGGVFNGNSADGFGGAINAQTKINIQDSEFGSLETANPYFNPVLNLIPNPNYNEETNQLERIQNPGYNPQITIANEDYNVEVPDTIPNPTFNQLIEGLIPNPDCIQPYVEYDGQCFISNTNRDDGEMIRHPLLVLGQMIDTAERIPNPEYDDRQTLTYLQNPSAALDWRSIIDNQNFNSIQFFPICENEEMECDDRETIELGNNAGIYGGAIFVNGAVEVINSNFSNNYSYEEGGAIYVENYESNGAGNIRPRGRSFIIDSQFNFNQSHESTGGALYSDNQILTISDSTFMSNHADEDGGAVVAYDTDLTIQNSNFTLNQSIDDDGGALDLNSSPAVISNSFFFGNQADDDGGAIFSDSLVVITGGAFTANQANGDGGAIDADAVQLARVTFENNLAEQGHGGALSIDNDGLSIVLNTIFLENEAPRGLGGAVYGSPWLLFNDFVDNQAAAGSAISLTGTVGTVLAGNILQGQSSEDASLCSLNFWNTPDNIATDDSCIGNTQSTGSESRPSLITNENLISRRLLKIDSDQYTNSSNGFVAWATNNTFIAQTQLLLEEELNLYQASQSYLDRGIQLQTLEDTITYVENFNPQTEFNPEFSYCSDLNNFYNLCLEILNHQRDLVSASISDYEVDYANIMNLESLSSETGLFLIDNLTLDHEQFNRSSTIIWTAGAIQETSSTALEDLSSRENMPVNQGQKLSSIRSSSLDAAERALRELADLKLAEEREAAKLAKRLAAEKRAAERKTKLLKLYQKLAATKTRGLTLKQKQPWILLMRNFVR